MGDGVSGSARCRSSRFGEHRERRRAEAVGVEAETVGGEPRRSAGSKGRPPVDDCAALPGRCRTLRDVR